MSIEVLGPPEHPAPQQQWALVEAVVRVQGTLFRGLFRPYRNGHGLEPREGDLTTLLPLDTKEGSSA